jgi:hypothetical protein
MASTLFALGYEGQTTGEIDDPWMQRLDKPNPELDRIWSEEAVPAPPTKTRCQ